MKHVMKKFLCLLLAFVLCFSGYHPSDIYGATVEVQQDESVEAAVESLRQQLVQRKSEVSASFQSEDDPSDVMNAVIQQVFSPTGKATEGDYLRYSIYSYGYQIYYRQGSADKTITITPFYMTTKEQEDALSEKIDQVLAGMNLTELSEYEKCLKIYNYITENVTYDYANLNDASYMLKYSAYAALMNGTAVCQGYAQLFYRMAMQAGLSVRMVNGTANGGGHAWNIVQIGDSYYYVDATWDAGLPASSYWYFLRGSENFLTDHTLSSNFQTEEFTARYTVSTSDYVYSSEPDTVGRGNCGNAVNWQVVKQSDASGQSYYTLTISGSGKMDSYSSFTDAPWKSWGSLIERIVVEKDVKAVGAHGFDGCSNLKEVILYPKMAKFSGEEIFPKSALAAYSCYENSTAESFLKHLQLSYTLLGTSDSKIKAAATGYRGTYDGKDHQIQVTVSNLPEGSYEIYYTTDPELYGGSFQKEPIVAKNTGTTRVYYYICAEDYSIFKGSADIVIEKADPGLKFDQTSVTKEYGDAGFCNTLQAVTDGSITYRSSDSSVASVDASGNVTIKGKGSCTITASAAESTNYKAGEVSYQITVEKEELVISSQPQDVTAAAGSMVTLQARAEGRGLSYQWRYSQNGQVLDAGYSHYENSDTLSIKVNDRTTKRTYWCHITDKYGTEVNTRPCHITYRIQDGYVASGVCGDNVTWTLDDTGLMIIGGNGPIKGEDVSWDDWMDQIKAVVFRGNITEIGDGAFWGAANLRTILLPGTLKKIGENAFYDLFLMEPLILPEGMESIGSGAFYKAAIPEIYIPSSVTAIGDNAFHFTISVKCKAGSAAETYAKNQALGYEIVQDTGDIVTVFGTGTDGLSWAYDRNTGVLTIRGNGKMNSYSKEDPGWYSLRKGITEVIVEEGITSIGAAAFYDFSCLQKVTLPESVKEIDDGAFMNCERLSTIVTRCHAPKLQGENIWKNTPSIIRLWYPAAASGYDADPWKAMERKTYVYDLAPQEEPQPSDPTPTTPETPTTPTTPETPTTPTTPETPTTPTTPTKPTTPTTPTKPATPTKPTTSKPATTKKPAATPKISLSASSKKIAAGRKVTLTVTQKSKKLSAKKVTWSSSNKKYATVSTSGVVTTKKAGAGKSVTITATLKSNKKVKATFKISIMKHAVTKIVIKKPPKTLKNGKSVTLKASVSANGSKASKTLKWTSSNTKYATVNSKGKVTAKKAGKGKSVKITAAATDGTGKKVTVTIKIK